MKRSTLLAILTLLAVFALASCTPAADDGTTNTTIKLPGSSWHLTELNGEPALADADVNLNFEEESIGGKDGCNSFGGSYTLTGSKLEFGDDIFSTMMYCGDPISAQSSAFYAALAETASYTVENGSLILLDQNGSTLASFSPIMTAE